MFATFTFGKVSAVLAVAVDVAVLPPPPVGSGGGVPGLRSDFATDAMPSVTRAMEIVRATRRKFLRDSALSSSFGSRGCSSGANP